MTIEEAKARGAAARIALMAAASRRTVWGIRGGESALFPLAQTLRDETLAFWWLGDDEDDDEDDGPDYEISEEGVAVIPVHGVLLDAECSWWMRYLGYASTPGIRDQVRAAAADANVTAILLDVDSPGGQAAGVADAADAIWAVRASGEKRIYAACREACSGGYWLASQCERIYAVQDAPTGCIGTLITLRDWSKYFAEMGIATLPITSDGAEKFKAEGAMGTVITPEQQADFKRIANETQALFSASLMRGRNLTAPQVAALADGRWHVGANAIPLGLVDRIASVEDVLTLLGGDDDLLGDDNDPPPGGSEDPADDDADDPQQLRGRVDYFSRRSPKVVHPPFSKTPAAGSGKKGMSVMKMTLAQARAFFQGGKNAPKTEGGNGDTIIEIVDDPAGSPAGAQGSPTAATPPALSSAEQEELKRLREFHGNALKTARESAKAAAVKAFGKDSPQLATAERAITAMSDPEAIRDLAATYEAKVPAGLRPGAGRITTSANLSGGGSEAEAGEPGSGDEWGEMYTKAAKAEVSRRAGANPVQRNGTGR